MGCTGSKTLPQHLSTQDVADLATVGMHRPQITTLTKIFNRIDTERKALITIEELVSYLAIESSSILEHVFSQVHRSSSRMISLREFILCLRRYLSLDQSQISKFLFQIFQSYNKLPMDRLREIVALADGNHDVERKMQNLLIMIDVDRSEKEIKYQDYELAVRKSPILLRPLVQLQTTMREKIGGASFWLKLKPLNIDDDRVKVLYGYEPPRSQRRVSLEAKQQEIAVEGSNPPQEDTSPSERRVSASGRTSRRRKSAGQRGSVVVTVTAIEGSPNRSQKGRRASMAASLHSAAVENAALQEVFKPHSGSAKSTKTSSRRRKSITPAD